MVPSGGHLSRASSALNDKSLQLHNDAHEWTEKSYPRQGIGELTNGKKAIRFCRFFIKKIALMWGTLADFLLLCEGTLRTPHPYWKAVFVLFLW